MSSVCHSDVPTVIDVEASGFGSGSYPIEVGFIRCDGQVFCTLIEPVANWNHWDITAAAIHGVDRALLFTAGRDVKTVAHSLNEYLGDQTVYTDAWGQDMCWLGLLFDTAQVSQRFRLESIYSLLTEEQLTYWDVTKAAVIVAHGGKRHRASADAKIIQSTYVRLQHMQ